MQNFLLCPKCFWKNQPDMNFCGKCGTKLSLKNSQEKKNVTAVFVDISSFMKISSSLEEEELKNFLASFYRFIEKIVLKFGGRVEKFLGDGVLIIFGFPKNFKNDAKRAIDAAILINKNPEFVVHTGIATGVCVEHNQELTGKVLNIASRLSDLAKKNEILIDYETFEKTRDSFEFEDLGKKKIDENIQALKIFKIKSEEHQEKNLLIEREKENQIFSDLFLKFKDEKTSCILGVFGDAGVGKSVFLKQIAKNFKNIKTYKINNFPYEKEKSYGAVKKLILEILQIKETDDFILKKKLDSLFKENSYNYFLYLKSIIDLNKEEDIQAVDEYSLKHNFFKNLYIFFQTILKEHPSIIIIEDIHWLDSSSFKFILHLLSVSFEFPIFIIFSGRFNYTISKKLDSYLLENFKALYTRVDLQNFSLSESEKLIDKYCSLDVTQKIINKSKGHPLFLNEIIKSLIRKNKLEWSQKEARWLQKQKISTIDVPSTALGIVLEKIDDLNFNERQFLFIASLIGINFSSKIIEEILKKSFKREIENLLFLNVIEKSSDDIFDFCFAHELFQKGTFSQILETKKIKIYEQIANATLIIFHDKIDKLYGFLSFCFSKAKQWNKAKEYLFKAGEQAYLLAADFEALIYYEKAILAYKRGGDKDWTNLSLASIERKIAEAYFRLGNHQKSMQALIKAFAYLDIKLPDNNFFSLLKEILRQVWIRIFGFKRKLKKDKSFEEAIKAFDLLGWINYFMDQKKLLLHLFFISNFTEKYEESKNLAHCFAGVGIAFSSLSFFKISKYYLNLSKNILEKEKDIKNMAFYHVAMAVYHDFSGNWQESISHHEKAYLIYEEEKNIRKMGNSKIWAAFLYNYQGDFEKSLIFCEQVLQLAKETKDSQLESWAKYGFAVNYLKTHKKEKEKGIKLLEDAICALYDIPDHYNIVQAKVDLAKAYWQKGKKDIDKFYDAKKHLDDAEKIIKEYSIKGSAVAYYYNVLILVKISLLSEKKDKKIKKVKSLLKTALSLSKKFKGNLILHYYARAEFFGFIKEEEKSQQYFKKAYIFAQKLGAKKEEKIIAKRINLK